MIEASWIEDGIRQSATEGQKWTSRIATHEAAIWSTSSFFDVISSRTKDSLRSS